MSRQIDTTMSFVFEELEPRIMYSADFAPGLADHAGWMPQAEVRSLDNDYGAVSAAQDSTARAKEIFFVDAGVQDYEQLVDDIRRTRDAQSEFEIVVLDASRDGVEQIGAALARHSGIAAVHIISHGTNAALQLGNTSLSTDTLAHYRDALAQWSNALSDDADVLLYGCDLAQEATGQALGSVSK